MKTVLLVPALLLTQGCIFEDALTLRDAHPAIHVSHMGSTVQVFADAYGGKDDDCVLAPEGFYVTIQGQPARVFGYGSTGFSCQPMSFIVDLAPTTDPLEIIYHLGDEQAVIRIPGALQARTLTVPDEVVVGEPFVIGWEPATDVGTLFVRYVNEMDGRLYDAAMPLPWETPLFGGEIPLSIATDLPEQVMTPMLDEGIDLLAFAHDLVHEIELCEMGDCQVDVGVWSPIPAHLNVVEPAE